MRILNAPSIFHHLSQRFGSVKSCRGHPSRLRSLRSGCTALPWLLQDLGCTRSDKKIGTPGFTFATDEKKSKKSRRHIGGCAQQGTEIEPNMQLCLDSLQHDFESLNANSMASDESIFDSDTLTKGSPRRKESPSCEAILDSDARLHAMEMSVDECCVCPVLLNGSMDLTPDSFRLQSFELSQQPSTELSEASSFQQSTEPIRALLRPSASSQLPRRFYRTFWRGITMRAIARNMSTTSSE